MPGPNPRDRSRRPECRHAHSNRLPHQPLLSFVAVPKPLVKVAPSDRQRLCWSTIVEWCSRCRRRQRLSNRGRDASASGTPGRHGARKGRFSRACPRFARSERHTIDHGPRFWAIVAWLCPDYRAASRAPGTETTRRDLPALVVAGREDRLVRRQVVKRQRYATRAGTACLPRIYLPGQTCSLSLAALRAYRQ